MNQVTVSMSWPGNEGMTNSVSIEVLVEPEDAEEQGERAAQILFDFTRGYGSLDLGV